MGDGTKVRMWGRNNESRDLKDLNKMCWKFAVAEIRMYSKTKEFIVCTPNEYSFNIWDDGKNKHGLAYNVILTDNLEFKVWNPSNIWMDLARYDMWLKSGTAKDLWK